MVVAFLLAQMTWLARMLLTIPETTSDRLDPLVVFLTLEEGMILSARRRQYMKR